METEQRLQTQKKIEKTFNGTMGLCKLTEKLTVSPGHTYLKTTKQCDRKETLGVFFAKLKLRNRFPYVQFFWTLDSSRHGHWHLESYHMQWPIGTFINWKTVRKLYQLQKQMSLPEIGTNISNSKKLRKTHHSFNILIEVCEWANWLRILTKFPRYENVDDN